MSKILLLGVGPLPFYENDYVSGIGTGTWQLALPLLRAGHEVFLVSGEFGVHTTPEVKYTHPPECYGALFHLPIPEPLPERLPALARQLEPKIEEFGPDAVVSAGSPIASMLALQLDLDLPTWFDLNGDIMTEVQAKLPFTSDAELDFFLRHTGRMLRHGDVFSTVSARQRLAVIGQLAMMGRLNRNTLGYELVHVIPNGIDARQEFVHDADVLRGVVVGPLDFVVLWSGGFNTWVDVDSLFAALELAMERSPRLVFAATGGGLSGHHTDGYLRFQRKIETSRFKDRFQMLGWIPYSDLHNTYLEADVGINVDLPVYESELGARNRFLSWMAAGLPVATTVTTEISRELVDAGAAFALPLRDPAGIADMLADLSENRERCRRVGMVGKEYAFKNFSFEATTRALLTWAEHPSYAPDHEPAASREPTPLDEALDMFLEPGTAGGSLELPPRARPKGFLERLLGR
ncbi:glycosyltransferase family 4 protein [bacterium]|nr:glycosyltransferase family 4 protein [bacterium]